MYFFFFFSKMPLNLFCVGHILVDVWLPFFFLCIFFFIIGYIVSNYVFLMASLELSL